MTVNLNKVKAMLVAACDSCKQDNRDIAMNMMEIALDELQNMEPQDIEDNIQIVTVNDGIPVENILENACFNDEEIDEDTTNLDTLLDNETAMSEDVARQTFHDMISKMFV